MALLAVCSLSGLPALSYFQYNATNNSHLITGDTTAQDITAQDLSVDSTTYTAGTTTRAPVTFTAGTNLTTPVDGSMEYDGTNFFLTSGGTRKELILEGQATNNANITGGTIDGTTIGGTTPASGTFLDLTANDNVILGSSSTDTLMVNAGLASSLNPDSTANNRDLGSDANRFDDLFLDNDLNLGAAGDSGTFSYNPTLDQFEFDPDNDGTAEVTISDAGVISGDGSGLTALNASSISTGTLADGRLSANVALRNASNAMSGALNDFQNNVDLGSDGTDLLTLNAGIDSTVIPDSTANNRDIGQDARRWNDIFASGDLNLGATGDDATISFNTTTDVLEIDTDNDGTPEVTIDNAGVITSGGSTVPTGSAGQWTDPGAFVHPDDIADNVIIGAATEGAATIRLNADGSALFNQPGANANFVIEGVTDANLFVADADGGVAGRIGIGVAAPTTKLDVNGTVNATEFTGGGSGLTGLDATDISTGTLADGRLSANVALRNASNAMSGALNDFQNNVDLGSDGTDLLTLNAGIDSTVIPDSTANNRDIGQDARRWNDIFASGDLNLGATGDDATISFNTTTDVLEIDTDNDGTPEVTIDNAGVITSGGSTVPTGSAGQWTDPGAFVHPDDIADNVIIGAATEGAATIRLNADGSALFNQPGANANFVIEGVTDANLFVADADGGVAGRIGIGVAAPSEKLDVVGNAEINGLVYVNAGSAAAPSYTFEADQDLGIYRAGTNILGFTTSGIERARVTDAGVNVSGDYTITDSAGNQFIGLAFGPDDESAPSYSFNLDNDTGMFTPTGGAVAFSTNGSETVRINSTGLMINTPTALAAMTVNGDYRMTDTAGNQFIGLAFGPDDPGAPSYSFHLDNDTGIFSTGFGEFGFSSNGVQKTNFGLADFTINPSGADDYDFIVEGDTEANLFRVHSDTDRITIGETDATPEALLEINSDTSGPDGLLINNLTATGDAILGFELGAREFTMGVDNSDGDKFKIGTTEIETGTSMTIDAAGDVGFGTTNPQATLHVNGASGTTMRIVDGNQGAGNILQSDADGDVTWVTPSTITGITAAGGWTDAGTTVALTNSTDDVGIGVGAPAVKLDVGDEFAGTGDVQEVVSLTRTSSGTGADGIGLSLTANLESASTAVHEAGSITFRFPDAGDGTEDGAIDFGVTIGGGATATNVWSIGQDGHFIPGADDTYDIGSQSARVRDLYLGPASLHVESTVGETTTARDWTLSVQETDGATEGNFRVSEGGSEYLTVGVGGNVGVGVANPTTALDVSGTVTATSFDGSGALLDAATIPLASLADGTDGQIITWDTNGDITAVGPGAAGQVLTSNGAGAAPSFQAAAGGSEWVDTGALISLNGVDITDDVILGGTSLGAAKMIFGQNNGNVTFNNLNAALADFVVKGSTEDDLLFVDVSDQEIGIGTDNPIAKLDVDGNVRSAGSVTVGTAGTFGITGGESNFYRPNTIAGGGSLNATDSFFFNIDSNNNETDRVFVWGRNGIDAPAGANELMRLEENGSLGIGTNDPSVRLDVRNSSTGGIANLFKLTADNSGGVGAAGLGTGLLFDFEHDQEGDIHRAASLDVFWENATDGAEDSAFAFNIARNGAEEVEVTRVNELGLIPGTDNTYDLGSAALSWQDLFADGTVTAGTTTTGNLNVSGTTNLGDEITDAITMTGVIQGTTQAMRFEGGAQAGDILFSMPDPLGDITITFPSASGTLLSTGNGFLDNGNSFGQSADLGTLDANALNFITGTSGPNTRMSISAVGNITVNAASSGTELAVTGETSSTSFQVPVSTNTDPRYSFVGKTDTGLSVTGSTSDLLHFITDGGTRMSMHSSGIDILASTGTELEVTGETSSTSFLAPASTSTDPRYSFVGKTDTGISVTGSTSDIMHFITDGVGRMTMHVTNGVVVEGSTIFNAEGNVILGDAATDTVDFNADIASNLIPDADATRNLGAAGAQWNEVRASSFIGGGAGLTGVALLDGRVGGQTLIGGTATTNTLSLQANAAANETGTIEIINTPATVLNPFGTDAGETSEIRFEELVANGSNYVGFKAPDAIGATNPIWTLPAIDGTNGQVLQTNGSGVLSFASAPTPANVVLEDGNTEGAALTLGTNDNFGLNFETNDTTRLTIDTSGHLIPATDDLQDLGSSSARFRDLYLGPTSLHIASNVAETTTVRDWTLSIQEADGLLEGNLRIREGATEHMTISDTGNVGIGQTNPTTALQVNGTVTATNFSGNASGLTGVVLTGGNTLGGNLVVGTNDTGSFNLEANNTVRMSINGTTGLVEVNPSELDQNFQVRGDTDSSLIFVDAGLDRVGIGNGSPSEKLDVTGNARILGDLIIAGSNQILTQSGSAAAPSIALGGQTDVGFYRASGGTDNIAFSVDGTEDMRLTDAGLAIGNTSVDAVLDLEGTDNILKIASTNVSGLTSSNEFRNIDVDFSAATKTWAQGNFANQRSIYIQPETIAFDAASTVTNASTVSISGAPVAGTNATLTNSYALNVESGTAHFGGNVTVDGTLTATVGGVVLLDGNTGAVTLGTNDATAVNIETAGTTRLTLDSSGSLVFNESSANGLSARFEGNTDANLLFLDGTNDRVGIRTATPLSDLQVDTVPGAGLPGGIAVNTRGVGDSTVRFMDGGTVLYTMGYDNDANIFSINRGTDLSNPDIIIDSAGEVGIGAIVNPTQALHVGGNILAQSNIYSGDFGGHAFATDTTSGLFRDAANKVSLRTSGTNRITADASGNVGIGSTNPVTTLDVNGTLTAPTILGGATAGADLTLRPSSNATEGDIVITEAESLSLDPFGTLAGELTELRFLELAANGTNYVGFQGPDNAGASNTIWTLPAADGTNGQVLQTNGSGVLSFVNSPAPSGVILVDGNSEGAALTFGTNDTFALNLETDGTTRLTVDTSGNLIPAADEAQDFGSSTARWEDVYIGDKAGGGTLDIGNNGDSATIEFDAASDLLEFDIGANGADVSFHPLGVTIAAQQAAPANLQSLFMRLTNTTGAGLVGMGPSIGFSAEAAEGVYSTAAAIESEWLTAASSSNSSLGFSVKQPGGVGSANPSEGLLIEGSTVANSYLHPSVAIGRTDLRNTSEIIPLEVVSFLFGTQSGTQPHDVFSARVARSGAGNGAGFGARYRTDLQNGSQTWRQATAIDHTWTDPTNGSEDAQIEFNVAVNGSLPIPIATVVGTGMNVTGTMTATSFSGSGASLTSIPVSGLANGTDGELITWSAAATPTTVAAGTAGQILTSNGAGAAPTFETFAGDSDWTVFGTDLLQGLAGEILFNVGSEANPVISFTGDENTGIYHPLADRIGFVTSATERMRIDNVGSVGIGMTPPASSPPQLTVRGLSAVSKDVLKAEFEQSGGVGGTINRMGALVASMENSVADNIEEILRIETKWDNATDGAEDAEINFYTRQDGGTVTFLKYDGASARIGINTAVPVAYLDINSTTDNHPDLAVGSAGFADSVVNFRTQNQTIAMGIDVSDSDKFKIADSTTLDTLTRLTMTTTGLIGIGSNTPSTVLTVASPSAVAEGIDVNNTSVGDPVLRFQLAGTNTFSMGIDNSDADKFKIGTSALDTSTRLTIDSSGNVGVGESSPTAPLEVACPSGFTNVKAGSTVVNQLGCMQTAQEGTSTAWVAASNDCFNTYGARLPTSSEWAIAAEAFVLTNESSDTVFEWTSDQLEGTTGIAGAGLIRRNTTGGALNFSISAHSNTHSYRCWIER